MAASLRTATGKKATGFVFYQGPSMIDGKPVVAIATGLNNSKNRKTGNMVQVYFFRSDIAPMQALRSGEDFSICGDCKHRAGSCYVRVEQGPTVVFKAFLKGNYPTVSIHEGMQLLAGHNVRLGAYGDAACVPTSYLKTLVSAAAGFTGYTHQWKTATGLQSLCMASCDTEAEYLEAKSQGWRAFYVVPKGYQGKPVGSFLCPASEEAGKKLTCTDCLACNGTATGRTASVFIPVHGVTHKQTQFNNLIQIGRN